MAKAPTPKKSNAKVARKTVVKAVAKPKPAPGIKKDGTTPGSKQSQIKNAELNAQFWANPSAYGGNPSMTNAIKDTFKKGPATKAVKELDSIRKSVGWGPSNFGTGAERSLTKKTKKK